ncbi:glycogen/starch/alpha-glucan phosphorylase (plasmid) [Pseudoalteromonas espejiana]
MVLYPNDSSENGKELRLRHQQYFLSSASIQDIVSQWVWSSMVKILAILPIITYFN